jgi:DNA-binding response OmpR family regulator
MTKPVTVLIADDVEAIAALIQSFLPPGVFETRVAHDGQEALDIFEQWRPEVVLLDIMMPILSGYQVLKAIRAKDDQAVIIMLTSRNTQDDVLSCSKEGINAYMVKPIRARALQAKILEGIACSDPERAKALAEMVIDAPETDGANRRRLG